MNIEDRKMNMKSIPGKRWRLPLVLLVTVLVAYFDRMNISFALPKIALDYGWNVEQLGVYGGLLMSVFYIGYGVANILLSPLGERFGPRKSLVVTIVLFSLFSAMQAPLGMILSALLAVRVLLGLGEGLHFPMMNMLSKVWFPLNERSRANAIWLIGISLSMIAAPFILVPLTEIVGWKMMFVLVALGGLLVSLPLVIFYVYDTPSQKPGMSDEEIAYIEDGLEKDDPEDVGFIEGVKFFTKKPEYWLLSLGNIVNNIAAHGFINWLPTYYTEGRKMEYTQIKWAVSIPFALAIVGMVLWSHLGDKTNRRSLISGLGFLFAAVGCYFAATVRDNNAAVALFSVTLFFQIAITANGFALVLRTLPRQYTATGIGLFNGITMMVGGALGPFIVGRVLSATGDYRIAILSLTVTCIIGAMTFFAVDRILEY